MAVLRFRKGFVVVIYWFAVVADCQVGLLEDAAYEDPCRFAVLSPCVAVLRHRAGDEKVGSEPAFRAWEVLWSPSVLCDGCRLPI